MRSYTLVEQCVLGFPSQVALPHDRVLMRNECNLMTIFSSRLPVVSEAFVQSLRKRPKLFVIAVDTQLQTIPNIRKCTNSSIFGLSDCSSCGNTQAKNLKEFDAMRGLGSSKQPNQKVWIFSKMY